MVIVKRAGDTDLSSRGEGESSTSATTTVAGLALFMFFFTAIRSLKYYIGFGRMRNAILRANDVTAQAAGVVTAGVFGNPAPTFMHATLDNLSPTDRVIVVGDVHGCLDELQMLLRKANWRKGVDTLVFVGDLVNKGPYSAGVVKFARESGSFSVRGNHDDSCIKRLIDYKEKGVEPAGYSAYIKDLSDEDVKWMMDMPYTITIPSHKTIVVHAGLVPGG